MQLLAVLQHSFLPGWFLPWILSCDIKSHQTKALWNTVCVRVLLGVENTAIVAMLHSIVVRSGL